jgi:AAA+ ATPase superfamily predicted ATPase
MKFYNRENELEKLNSIVEKSKSNAQFTYVVGRRRIGKTSLLLKSVSDTVFLYFFVSRKNEQILCLDFKEEIERKMEEKIYGSFSQFSHLFEFLMHRSKKMNFTLIIDEFQEFQNINPSIMSDIQRIWDLNKMESKLNLIVCGSIYSMMYKIFENSKEPLFGRATNMIRLQPFSVKTIKEIYQDNATNFSAEDLLSFYMYTGGVAKYVELFVQEKAFTKDKMLQVLLAPNSYFLEEGKNALIEEFGKDYGTYFSILSLIASSKTARPEIESILEREVGGYLDRLENVYNIIEKVKPIFAKDGGRLVKYYIKDNFLNFWFRYFYKQRAAIEIGNLNYVKTIVENEYSIYAGSILERYFLNEFKNQNFNQVGRYWERGNLNEIDLVAVNDLEKRMVLVEVKMNPKKINIEQLKRKAEKLVAQRPDYFVEYKGLSLEDIKLD